MATNYNNAHKATQNQATQVRRPVTNSANGGAGRHFSPAPKNTKKSSTKIFSLIAIIVGVILLIAAAVMFGREWFGSKTAADDLQKAQSALVSSDGAQPPAANEEVPTNAQIPVVDWDKLHAINKDICAWLQIPGTNINYPVVQGATNDDYILTTLSGVSAVEGSIFLDSDSSRNIDDRHSIVYGHNIQNGSMFHAIASYVNKGFFDEHRTVYYITPEKNYVLKAIATYLTDGNDTNVRVFDFASDAEFQSWLKGRLDASVVKADDFKVEEVNHLFEFSTCSYSRKDGRTILLAIEDKTANNQSDPNAKPVNSSEGQMVKQ